MSSESEPVAYDIAELKAGGLMKQSEKDLFSVRLRVVGGYMKADQLEKLAEISRKYGRGHIHLTTRQGAEIPYISFHDVEDVRCELAEVGLEFGACGTRVRTITACQGLSCYNGLIDAQALAAKLDEKFFGKGGYPHKFKIGIAGCPNACTKPHENDLGIMGNILKVFVPDRCTLCGLCVKACPIEGALEIIEGELQYHQSACVRCGACIASCPTDAWVREAVSYAVFAGGKMGKNPRFADRLPFDITDENSLVVLIDRVLEWYKRNGVRGERFGTTIDRVGLGALVSDLQQDLGDGGHNV